MYRERWFSVAVNSLWDADGTWQRERVSPPLCRIARHYAATLSSLGRATRVASFGPGPRSPWPIDVACAWSRSKAGNASPRIHGYLENDPSISGSTRSILRLEGNGSRRSWDPISPPSHRGEWKIVKIRPIKDRLTEKWEFASGEITGL